MQTSDARGCDACGAPITALLYAISVQQYLIDDKGQHPIDAPLDLRMCVRCACGLSTHALPLAMQNRQQQLDRSRTSHLSAVPAIVPDPQGRN